MNDLNEEHVVAAILTAGLLSNSNSGSASPASAAELYSECLSALLDTVRPTIRDSEV